MSCLCLLERSVELFRRIGVIGRYLFRVSDGHVMTCGERGLSLVHDDRVRVGVVFHSISSSQNNNISTES